MKPDHVLLLTQLLDLHLSRTINREKRKDRIMRKFVQLAEDVEADLKGLDNDADDLNHRRLQVKESARQVVNDHHRIQDRIEEGIAAMRRVSEAAGLPNTRTAEELAEIAAANKKFADDLKNQVEGTPALGEGSVDTSDKSFQSGKDA
jgi:methyl-accepting chemotaxis protein